MALGKYSRVDGKKSPSSYCSTVSLFIFVALCLVGVWMLTSSSVVPVQNVEVSAQEAKDEVKGRASEIKDNTKNIEHTETNPKQFEDNSGDLSDEATQGNNNDSSDTQKDPDDLEKNNGNPVEKNHEGIHGKENTEEEKKPEDTPNSEKDNGDEEPKSKDPETEEIKTDDNNEKKENSEGNSNEEKKPDGNNVKKEGSEESLNEEKSPEDNGGENNNKDDKNEIQGKEKILEAELFNETSTQNGDWKTQASESNNEHESSAAEYKWKLCNVTAGPDYIPCLDNWQAIRNLRSTKHYEHRERHCPEDPPTCLAALPQGYQRSIEWPTSREKIWYHNVPHTELAKVKGHQNWVKVSGDYLTFPGGGTQFKYGALHYIDFIQQSVPNIAWGKRSRVVLDVGCGVASFGGFLFDRDVLTMSFAPKDEHEAQVQFALERGIPGISAVMGTKRLPFSGRVFDTVHCARCRVPWHIDGGKLLLELNRVLRPGGYFVWSATPVYQNNSEDAGIWQEMTKLTKAMCWDLVSKTKDKINRVGIAIYRKPVSNECYKKRSKNEPPVCQDSDDPNAAWNVPLQACMHKIPVHTTERGSQWPEQWPNRLTKPPYWLLSTNRGVYGKPAPEDFTADHEHWKRVVTNSYLKGMGIDWSTVRNVMDMKSIYGGFAAALKDLNVWVMNVVPLDSPDTLPVIYERGLFGIYHDWCESFNTYPRSYDLLHADHLYSKISKKCNILGVVAETDRILRPEGKLIVRDKVETVSELESLFKAMHWEVRLTYSKDGEGLLLVQKTMWRPTEVETIPYAIE